MMLRLLVPTLACRKFSIDGIAGFWSSLVLRPVSDFSRSSCERCLSAPTRTKSKAEGLAVVGRVPLIADRQGSPEAVYGARHTTIQESKDVRTHDPAVPPA